MIDVCRTYETWDYEAAEAGETNDRGYVWQNYPHTFRELVELMTEHYHPSCWPMTDHDAGRIWFTSDDDENFRTGERTRYSIHLSRPDEPRQARYWLKAWKAANNPYRR
jgi:hypothetical protein